MALLAGRFAVVTGGGSGIGRGICEKLAEQGARLIVADIDEMKAKETVDLLGTSELRHRAVSVDVSQRKDVEELGRRAIKEFGGCPQVVVNCAGITRDSTLLKMKDTAFDQVMDVNLKSVYLMTQLFSREAVQAQTPLSIVNVASIVAKMGNFGQCNYAASKAGVVAFTKSAAKELATKGIRVNAVLPGFIETPMTGLMPPKVLEQMCAMIPMKRLGTPEEIANGVLYLASDMSRYVTGTQLEITGGFYM